MINHLLNYDWMGLLLVAVTMFFIAEDRAFSRQIRRDFHIASLLCIAITLLGNHLKFSNDSTGNFSFGLVELLFMISRFAILILLFDIFRQMKKARSDYYFSVVLLLVLVITIISEVLSEGGRQVNNILCIITSVFYYYFVMQTYKKDRLTGLLLRHNLIFEMKDLAKKSYNVVLTDVDNFKLINDKYGHDKGDEVLVLISNVVKNKLPKATNAYRFGGDEFVIISRKSSTEELKNCMEEINAELSKDNLRISYGIAGHKAGEDGDEILAIADKRMYENKRFLKSEDIWNGMTGLFNFQGFLDELELFRSKAGKDNQNICLFAFDIDRLADINMTFGYTEGNIAIKSLAQILREAVKENGFIGHLGSDDFAVAVLCNSDTDEFTGGLIEDVKRRVNSSYELMDKEYTLRLNCGKLFVEGDDKNNTEQLVDNLLYLKQSDKENRRKNANAHGLEDYDENDAMAVFDILDNNRLKYAFQPIVSAVNGDIVAYESLMRSDTENMISPLKIIKYAEHSKRLYEVEKYTFFNVLSTIMEKGEIRSDRRIFINSIPGFMLNDEDYELVHSKYSSFFDRIVIELTEQRDMTDESLAIINARRDKDGFNIAIDDYGAGYSNTTSLLRYMPQVVKLDRLLITGIERNAKKQFFVKSIISFARENDMMTLAEGVETESELKTVIRLGVDMIQGFFTAKPSFEIIDSIPEDIKKLIIGENLKVGSNQRMIYNASENRELSTVSLAMEDYTKINISASKLLLKGSPEYTADMVVKIKDKTKCHLEIVDVNLNSVDDEPCIELGEEVELILELDGNSKLNAKGIHVPESSSLTVIGSGNLEIFAKGHQCYAIGSDTESGFGNITFKNSGIITIGIDGEKCVGIGGGIAKGNSGINILSGGYRVNVAGVEAVAFGCYDGVLPLNIRDCAIKVDFRVNSGMVIGNFHGIQNINIKNFNLELGGSGTRICGIGCCEESGGSIDISYGTYYVRMNGQKVALLGSERGKFDIRISHVRIDIIGEGDKVIGFGSEDYSSDMNVEECSLTLVINSSVPVPFGIGKDISLIGFTEGQANIKVNGNEVAL